MLSSLSISRAVRVMAATLGGVLTAALAPLALSPVAAASAHHDAATTPLTPSVDAAAHLFPYLSDGHAETSATRDVYVKGEDCVSNDSAGRAKRGESTTYTLRDGSEPVASGHHSPRAEVYELGNARKARAAFQVLQDYSERCRGRHVGVRYEVWVKFGRNLRLGDEGLAYGLKLRSGDGVHGSSTVRSTVIVVRVGSRLVQVDVASWGARPSVRETVKWAQLVLHDLP